MEIIFKIIAIGLITCFAVLIVKPIKNDFALIIGVVGGIVILSMVLNCFSSLFSSFSNIVERTGLNKDIFSLIIKIVGIGYLTEFSANLCSDCGNNGLADKMLLGGKVALLVLSLPIINNILSIVTELLPWKRNLFLCTLYFSFVWFFL